MKEHLPVRVIQGGVHRDSRGMVAHVNAFTFERVDRFYIIEPSNTGEIRGWVGHRRDWKWFFAAKGHFNIGVATPIEWGLCAPEDHIESFILESSVPTVLEVPPGRYTAIQSLVEGAMILVFSSGGIGDAHEDNFRLPVDSWRIPRP